MSSSATAISAKLKESLEKIQKKYGKESIMIYGDEPKENVEVISTGVPSLNRALGIGGLPCGRVIEIYGQEAAGKSTVALQIVAEAQKDESKVVAYVDTEHCLSAGSLIYNPTHKRNYTSKELFDIGEVFDVLSYNGDGTFSVRQASIKYNGRKQLFLLTLQNGITLKLTGNHKVLTQRGYVRVDSLTDTDKLYTPKTDLQNVVSESESDIEDFSILEDYFLLGFYHGDGTYFNGSSTPYISNVDEGTLQYIDKISRRHGCEISQVGKYSWTIKASQDVTHSHSDDILSDFNSGYTLKELSDKYTLGIGTVKTSLFKKGVSSSYNFRTHASSLRNKARNKYTYYKKSREYINPNKLSVFLRSFSESHIPHNEIRLPSGLTINQLRYYIAGYITADGTVIDVNKQRKAYVGISSKSLLMLKDIQSSLMLFGITSSIYPQTVRGFVTYNLAIRGVENLKLLYTNFPLISYKKTRLENVIDTINICNRSVITSNKLEMTIQSIQPCEIDDTYDISVHTYDYNHQNFLCENIIIHNSLNPDYAEKLGVNMDTLLFSQPTSGEEALDIVMQLAESGEVSLVVLDSIAALVTKAELNGELTDSHVAQVPRLMSIMLKQLIGIANKSKCAIVFINQLRANIGGYGYAPADKPTGGKSLPFYASVRLDVRRVGAVKGSGEEIVGQKVKIKVVKNKLAAPHKEAEVDLIFGEGFSKESDLLDIAIDKKIFEKKGAWFYYNGNSFAQGREAARKALKDEDFYSEIEELINE